MISVGARKIISLTSWIIRDFQHEFECLEWPNKRRPKRRFLDLLQEELVWEKKMQGTGIDVDGLLAVAAPKGDQPQLEEKEKATRRVNLRKNGEWGLDESSIRIYHDQHKGAK